MSTLGLTASRCETGCSYNLLLCGASLRPAALTSGRGAVKKQGPGHDVPEHRAVSVSEGQAPEK